MSENDPNRNSEMVSISTLAILCLLLYAYTQHTPADSTFDSPLSPLEPTGERIYYPYMGGYFDDIQTSGQLEMLIRDREADIYQLSHDPRVYVVAPHDPDYDPTSGIEYIEQICEPDTITWYRMPPETELVIDPEGDDGVLFNHNVEAVEILCKKDKQ